MTNLARGQILGDRFQLEEPLSELGAGEVWLARDIELRDRVVAKILPANAPESAIELLRRECRSARKLVHPGIVPVYELHRVSDRYLVTMDIIEGKPAHVLRDRPLSEILRVLAGVADALGYAHDQGVVHRDVKAANVLVDDSGEPHVIDFGIAAALSGMDRNGDNVTSDVRGGGTRGHRSPQQAAGAAATVADDIYSFGRLARDLVSGQVLSEPLSALLSSMTNRDPRHRPKDMAEVREALKRAAREGQAPNQAQSKRIKLTPPPRVVRPNSLPARNAGVSGSRPPEPATLRPPGGRGGMGVKTILAFVLLLATAGFVVIALPEWAERNRLAPGASPETTGAANESSIVEPGTTKGEPAPDPTEGPADLEVRAASKARAMEKRERAVSLKESLQARQAGAWGGEGFRSAVDAIDVAEEAVGRRDYPAAERDYDEALSRLEAVNGRAAEVFADAMKRGESALAAGSATAAEDAFALARRIRPNDAGAERGLARSKVVDEIRLLVAEAERLEQNGSLEQAAERYRRATAMDSLYRPAQEGLARVDGKASEAAFAAAMSEAVRALNDSDFEAARAAYERAGAIRPGAPDVASGIAAVDAGVRLRTISEHRTKAAGLEAGESWREAEKHYQAVLAIDPTIRFAREGKDRTAQRAALSERLDFHIGNPERLSEDRVLEEANALVGAARAVDNAGQRHQLQLQRLSDLVAEFETPVQVHLLSDGQTEVVVYRIGTLGRFDQRALVLRPGTYTVVGRRQGYRDVRYSLVVRAESPPEPLTVRCEEPI